MTVVGIKKGFFFLIIFTRYLQSIHRIISKLDKSKKNTWVIWRKKPPVDDTTIKKGKIKMWAVINKIKFKIISQVVIRIIQFKYVLHIRYFSK